MFLFPLAENPKLSAEQMADVHLNQGVTSCAQIFSTALQKVGSLFITVLTESSGKKIYKYKNLHLIPPLPNTHPLWNWVKWTIDNKDNAWYLTAMSYWM